MPSMLKKLLVLALLATVSFCLLGIVVYNLPPVHDRLAWRVENIRTQIKYTLHPPEQVVFVPQQQQEQIDSIVRATLQALQASPTPSPSATLSVPTAGPTSTATPSPTPTIIPTPIPSKVILTGIIHEYETMNNCGPDTLAMNLSYWGWKGDQNVTRKVLRPNKKVDDKNVSPQELVNYVNTQTDFKAILRVGGDIDLLKRLIAAGFPVIVEKGFQPGKEYWMGHYALVNGYDDKRSKFITQDSYIMPDFPVPYADLQDRWWRDFDNLYLVIYPQEREAEVLSILGPNQADPQANFQYAEQKAVDETQTLSGRDLFFAWYNRGTNLLYLKDYTGAAAAYDQAFALYPSIPEHDRPWRLLWYQTGPYEAYYRTGRYQDVINLADTTFAWIGDPVLEETFYWRGMAYLALGNQQQGVSDLQQAASLNPNSTSALEQLHQLGVEAP